MKIVENWKKLFKSYSVWAFIANILVALSVTGLSVLGVLTSGMAFKTLAISATVLGIAGFAGRFIQQDLEDGKLFFEDGDDA